MAINELRVSLVGKLKGLGAIQVREHASCGAKQHTTLSNFSVVTTTRYWRLVLEDGRVDAHTVEDGLLYIDGVKMARGGYGLESAWGSCPCRPGVETEHSIYEYLAWPDSPSTCLGVLAECREILDSAQHRAGAKKPRAAIREQLLKCLIILNDAIAPVSAEDFIRAQKKIKS